MFHVPEKYRITKGKMGSTKTAGNNGAFLIKSINYTLHVIASDGEGWEHVSVSKHNRCPTWEEMCYIKNLFWDNDDFVVQMHPEEKDYINNHRFCLHLWRKAGTNDFCEKPDFTLV